MSIETGQVKDQEAYNMWMLFKDAPQLQIENRLIQTSDPYLVVDPLMALYRLKEKIVHLPGDEQSEILSAHEILRLQKFQEYELYKKAFGSPGNTPSTSQVLQKAVIEERGSELLELFGRYLNAKEVHKIVTEDWGYHVGLLAISRFENRNKEAIDKRKQSFKKDFSDIRFSHKKARLEELSWMYLTAKGKYLATESQAWYKNMLQVLLALQKETDDHTLRIEHEINAKIELTINYHLQQEVMSGLAINDIILARISARQGINPRVLLARLHKCVYAQYTGFFPNKGALDEGDLQYPSKMVYNWVDIKRAQESNLLMDEELAQYEILSPEVEQKLDKVKGALLSGLHKKEGQLKSAQDRINEASFEV